MVYRWRVLALLFFCFAFIIFYLFYLFGIQVQANLFYSQRAHALRQREIVIPAARGKILDRSGKHLFASNRLSYQLDFDYSRYDSARYEELLRCLEEDLGFQGEQFIRRLDEAIKRRQSVSLGRITFDKVAFLSLRHEMYPELVWSSITTRFYPISELMSHIVGYIGEIAQKEYLALLDKEDYNSRSLIGKTGIEREYDQELRGQTGRRYYRVNALGETLHDHQDDYPIKAHPGDDIELTIDAQIQDLAEKALGDRYGSAIVLKPSSGEILAMVSYPGYDANSERLRLFTQGETQSEYSFYNRGTQGMYAPASTFKLIMTAALLSEGKINPQRKVLCTGQTRVGNRIFKCHNEAGHGYVNMQEAVAQSCNIYFYEAGLYHLGPDTILRYAQDFGLGQETGVDLPGEKEGFLPSLAWKQENRQESWVGGDTANLSIGQGFTSVTPLQMANAVALIVNEGIIYRPHFLKRIISPDGNRILENKPEVLHRSEFVPESVFKTLKYYMRTVVTQGASRYVISTPHPIAGKTGTGQTGLPDAELNWFIAFGPYGAPVEKQLVVVVLIEARNLWDWWSPKAVDLIMHGALEKKSYEEVVEELNPWYLRP